MNHEDKYDIWFENIEGLKNHKFLNDYFILKL